jgi:hypothetical protein
MARFCSRQVLLYYYVFLRNLFSKLKQIPDPIAQFAMMFKIEVFTGSKYTELQKPLLLMQKLLKKI